MNETGGRQRDVDAAPPSDAPPKKKRWSRRRFLALGVAGGGLAICTPYRFGFYEGKERFQSLDQLSPTQAVILLAIVDTMLAPSAGSSEAQLIDHVRFIDSYLGGIHPDDRDQVGTLLLGLEHLTLPFGPHLSRFTRLDREARSDYLRGWQTSGMGLRRLGFRSLKALVYLAHYRTLDAFAEIGYPGPIAPGYQGPPASRARYDALLAPEGEEPGSPG